MKILIAFAEVLDKEPDLPSICLAYGVLAIGGFCSADGGPGGSLYLRRQAASLPGLG